MKKNLILGLFLISVLLISVVGIVSAAKNLPYGSSCSSSGECSAGNICLSASTGPLAGQGYKCQPSIEQGDVSPQETTATSVAKTGTRTPSTGTKTSAGASARKSSGSGCPRGWDTLIAEEDGNPCCRKATSSGRATGRFLGFMFRD